MKLITYINKLFGAELVQDMMEAKHEDDEAIEYYAIDAEEGDSEPSYFIRVFANGMNQVSTINNDDILHTSYSEKDLKKYLKTLAK